MYKEHDLWQFIAGYLQQKQTVMLLIVVQSSGSSPGRQGFKMAVASDGDLCGSIGGGIMEVKLVEMARDRLRTTLAESLVKKQIHRKSAPHDQSGMICSGEQTILFFPLEYRHLRTVKKILSCLHNQIPATLQFRRKPEELQFQVDTKNPPGSPFQFEFKDEQSFFYAEKTGFKNKLYIIGGGHCALALSELMSKMDFYLCLLDDRPDLNTLLKNNFVHEKKVLESYEQVGELVPSGPDVYVVVMTVGYRSDEQVLRQLLSKNFRYLGLLGSAAKVGALLETLKSEGFPVEKISAPVGLAIKSRTPEEIAVSIAAELILIKNREGQLEKMLKQ